MSNEEKPSGDGSNDGWVYLVIIVLLAFIALPAAILMFIFGAIAKNKRGLVAGLGALGIALFLLFGLKPFKAELTVLQKDLGTRAWSRIFAHAPRFWLYTLAFAPAAGLIWETVRPRSVEETLARTEQERVARDERRERQQWKKAEKAGATMKVKDAPAPLGVVVHMTQDLPDFERKGQALSLRLNSSVANLHGLILGGSGAGKTETIKRLVSIFASQTDYDIFLIDPKPTDELKITFAGLVSQSGRRYKLYPDEPFNGFRGDARALHNRLLTIPVLGTEGASAYYAEMTEEYLWLGINAGATLPRSFADVVQRLDYDYLLTFYANDAASLQSIQRIKRQDANSITMRFNNIARKFGDFNADGWAFEDVQAGYFALPVLESSRDVDAIARYLIEDLKHYFSARKSSRRTVVIFDEFSAFGAENVVNLMELVRSLGGIVFIASQTTAALGDDRLQKRILGNVTTYLQRMNDPRDIAQLGGMQQTLEVSRRLSNDPTPQGMVRYTEKAVIDPTKVAQLPVGGAYIINRGRVAQIKISQAPTVDWDGLAKKDFSLAVQWHNFKHPESPITIRPIHTIEPPPAIPTSQPELPPPPAVPVNQPEPPAVPEPQEQPPAVGTMQAKMISRKMKPRPRKPTGSDATSQPVVPNQPDDDFI